MISVIVPTIYHEDPQGRPYVDRAVESASRACVRVRQAFQVVVVPGFGGQARAVNEAVRASSGDVLAFLDDDDVWAPHKLEVQLPHLDRYDIVTCSFRTTQGRLGYYPVPSGWVMRRQAWYRPRGLDETLHYHTDTDWLGKTAAAGMSRIHLVEPPEDADHANQIAHVSANSDVVDGLTETLLWRTVRPGSMIATSEALKSEHDYAEIRRRYGYVPW